MGRVIIIGGGVAGLAAAASFASEGWETEVYEKNQSLIASGNGFPIFPNGARVLRALAGDTAVESAGWRLERLTIRQSNSHDIVTFKIEDELKDGGLLIFKRQNLLDVLADAAKAHGAKLFDGQALKRIEEGRIARFEDGSAREADLIVGADGVYSRVRRSIFPDVELKDHRKGAIRMLIPYEASDFEESPLREAWEYNDPSGRRVGLYPVSDSQLYLLLVFVREDTAVQSLPVDVEEWLKTFPTLSRFLERARDEGHLDVYHSIEPPRWSADRVAIVGDAAHGMTPALGQGANTSLMTGFALGKCVKSGSDIPRSLRQWEMMMRPIALFTQKYAEGMTAGRFDPENDVFFTEPVIQPLLQADIPSIFS